MKNEKKERTLEDLSVTNWLTPQNASFMIKTGSYTSSRKKKKSVCFFTVNFLLKFNGSLFR